MDNLTTNQIYVFSSDVYRIKKFDKYYNVWDKDSDAIIDFIVDDRRLSSEDRKEVLRTILSSKRIPLGQIHYVTDMIDVCREKYFTDAPFYDKILDVYGLSVKLLTFVFAKTLGVEKSMMLDDDVFLLKPVDSFFQYDYVKKADTMSKMGKKAHSIVRSVFPESLDLEQMNADNHRINSGTLIYKFHESLIADLHAFFSSEQIYTFLKNERRDDKKPSHVGHAWLVEQYTYSCHLHRFGQENLHDFGSEVRMVGAYPKKKPKDTSVLKNAPNILHFVLRDKKRLYEHYSKVVNNTLKNN